MKPLHNDRKSKKFAFFAANWLTFLLFFVQFAQFSCFLAHFPKFWAHYSYTKHNVLARTRLADNFTIGSACVALVRIASTTHLRGYFRQYLCHLVHVTAIGWCDMSTHNQTVPGVGCHMHLIAVARLFAFLEPCRSVSSEWDIVT